MIGRARARRAATTASSSCSAIASGSVPGRMTSLPPAQIVHEVGLEGDGRLDLVGDDLRDQLAADREVRVGEVVDLLRQHLGDAIGPAAMPAGGAGVGVADALGERVADGDEAPPRVGRLVVDVRGGSVGSLVCHPALLRERPATTMAGRRSDRSSKVVSRGARRSAIGEGGPMTMNDPRLAGTGRRSARVRRGALRRLRAELSPSFPQRAPWGTASKLRAWQQEALDQYFRDGPTRQRDFLVAATPGAGKTTFALRSRSSSCAGATSTASSWSRRPST